jgi:hypothetical protein
MPARCFPVRCGAALPAGCPQGAPGGDFLPGACSEVLLQGLQVLLFHQAGEHDLVAAVEMLRKKAGQSVFGLRLDCPGLQAPAVGMLFAEKQAPELPRGHEGGLFQAHLQLLQLDVAQGFEFLFLIGRRMEQIVGQRQQLVQVPGGAVERDVGEIEAGAYLEVGAEVIEGFRYFTGAVASAAFAQHAGGEIRLTRNLVEPAPGPEQKLEPEQGLTAGPYEMHLQAVAEFPRYRVLEGKGLGRPEGRRRAAVGHDQLVASGAMAAGLPDLKSKWRVKRSVSASGCSCWVGTR